MQLFKNKFFLGAAAIVLIWLGIWQYKRSGETIDQQELLFRIQRGYTQQFCSVVFPQLSGCITISNDKCPNLVAKHIDSCLLELKIDLPNKMGNDKAKEIYEKVGTCFQDGVHKDLVNNYMVDSPQCKERLS